MPSRNSGFEFCDYEFHELNELFMKNFDLQRFGRVLRLDFAVGQRQLLVYSIGGVMLYLFFFWFAHNIAFSNYMITDWKDYLHHVCEAVAMFGILTMNLFFLVVASTLWRHEQPKTGRTRHLMLPATQLEKFLSRWVYMFVLSVTAGCLTFFVADAIHIAWLWLTDKPVVAASTYLVNALPKDSSHNALAVYWMLLCCHAFFFLGGVVLRKFHFALTAVTALVLYPAAFHFLTPDQPYLKWLPISWRYGVMDVLYIVLPCVFTVLAYRLYCRWQVATRNFVNLP